MRCKVFYFRIKEFRALAFEGTASGLSANKRSGGSRSFRMTRLADKRFLQNGPAI